MDRRLAAILATDVVGYTRLIRADEEGTIAALKSLRADLIDPKIAAHHGRIVKLMGDGMLAEFPSVVDAVRAAVETQQAVAEHNSVLPEDKRIEFRVMAEPGGICISGMVYEGVRDRIDIPFEDLGEQEVKNIDRPVRVWRWTAGAGLAASVSAKMDEPLPLPDKPSIAVLPFDNMSADPEQEYFADGISEDIITELSRFRTLFVIARNSSFAFKGGSVDIAEIGRRLAVQYVVEGSVRRAGNRVRITAQLVEAETGNHLWAERYDREIEDIFAVQDEVTRSIVAILPGRVQDDVAARAARKPTDNMKAYELMLQGKSLRDGLNAEDTAEARRLLEKAIKLDPRYARAHMYLADTYVVDLWLGLAAPDASGRSLELSRRGAALDNNDAYIQDQLGFAYLCEGLWEDAEAQFEKTISKIVNEAESMAWCGYGFMLLGRHEKARDIVLEAMRLDPLHPPALDWILGQIHYFTQRYDRYLIGEALLNSLAHAFLVGAYAHLGRDREARIALDAFVIERHREFSSRKIFVENDTIESLAGSYRKMWRNRADWEHLANGLRKAGLPD
jgi:TolB-like protein